jgi:hypothetical protein
MEHIAELVAKRLDIGRERYQHELLTEENKSLNFYDEALEELLDAVVYSTADYVRHECPLARLIIEPNGDSVSTSIVVDESIERGGNDKLKEQLKFHMERKYDYRTKMSAREQAMHLCIFVLSGFLKLRNELSTAY